MNSNRAWSLQTRYLVLVIALLLLAGLVYYARELLSPLLIAALIAYVLDPAVGELTRRTRLKHRAAASLVYVLFLAVMAAIPAALAPMMYTQLAAISFDLSRMQELIEALIGQPLAQLGLPLELDSMLDALFDPQRIFGVLQVATANIAWILVILVTTYYFLLDGARLLVWLFRLVPPGFEADALRLYRQVRVIWQAYLRGQLLLMSVMGITTGISMAVIGLPDALLIGILTGALDVIPSVGPAIAMVISAAVALYQGSIHLPLPAPWFALLVVIVFTAIQTAENVWLRPRIFGQRLQLHPAVVFVAIVGALALAGVLVALVIVPLISSAAVIGHYLYRRILGLEPWPEDNLPGMSSAEVEEENYRVA